MKLTRRDVLRFAGGSVLGALFTPIPWKLLDDSSIWTQNWSLIPPLPRGPITTKFTHCPLCSAGCTAKARCVNGVPVGLSGVPNLATRNGMLCAVGLAAHHVAYHPLRLSGPQAFTGKDDGSVLMPVTLDALLASLGPKLRAVMSSASAGAVAVLDQRPGRAMSRRYQKFLSGIPGSMYVVSPSREDGMLGTLRALSGSPCGPMGFDFENTKTVLSVGAPLLDGWGVPERMQVLFADTSASGKTLMQIESSQSRTARGATTWLPVVPGTEAALALSFANVIFREGLYPKEIERTITDFPRYRELVLRYHPHPISALTGVSPDTIVDTARKIAGSPSIVIAGADPARGPLEKSTEILVAGLNLLLGAPARSGGITLRREMPDVDAGAMPETPLHRVPDHSIGLLIMDGAEYGESFPTSLLKRKMVADGGTVVLLSPHLSARSASADYLIPTPSPFESWEEHPTPPGAAAASFSVSAPLLAPRETSVDAVRFLGLLSEAIGMGTEGSTSPEAMLRQRSDAIQSAGRGTVYAPDGAEGKPVSAFSDGDEAWQAFLDGGCWVDEPAAPARSGRFSILGTLTDDELATAARPRQREGAAITLTPTGVRAAMSSGSISPILSKIFQESDLRGNSGTALINPTTASQLGIQDGSAAVVRSRKGTLQVRLMLDPAVRPGLLQAAVGPWPNGTSGTETMDNEGVLAICEVQEDGTWRFTDVTIEKA